MEQQLADMEFEAKQITDCWLRQCKERNYIEIPEPNREIMSLFLTLQLLRTAEARIELLQFAQLLQTTGEIDPTYDARADVKGLHGALLWDDDLVKSIRKKIQDCIWIFACNDFDQPFFTSDHPALVKSKDHKMWIMGPRVFELGMYVVIPLTPRWIWYCKDRQYWKKLAEFDRSVSPVRFTPDMVNHENSGQVGMCSRFVFSRSANFAFAWEYCKAAPGVIGHDRDRFKELPPLEEDPIKGSS
jgi:hypothetical protein